MCLLFLTSTDDSEPVNEFSWKSDITVNLPGSTVAVLSAKYFFPKNVKRYFSSLDVEVD